MALSTKLFRSTTAKTVPLRAQVIKYRPGAGQEKVRKWMAAMSQKATTPDSKNHISQLSSLITYFNKPSQGESIPEIDWGYWKENINTDGFVDKLKSNHDALRKEEYDVEKVAINVATTGSKDLDEITNELHYHGAVWVNAYADYKLFLFELEEYGNPNDYLMHENYDFFYGLEAELEELIETHNYLPGAKDDLNLRSYYASQFNWGKKVISYYRHPADDFKAAKATKNILGR